YNIELVERLLRRFRLAFGVTKRREVVLADQSLGGFMHRIGVELAWQTPDMTDLERQIGAAVADAIEIMTPFRREPRLEVIRHDLRAEHADRMRSQMGVQAVPQSVRGEWL